MEKNLDTGELTETIIALVDTEKELLQSLAAGVSAAQDRMNLAAITLMASRGMRGGKLGQLDLDAGTLSVQLPG